MEQIAISLFSSLGITGIGFFFMWMVLRKYFQQTDSFINRANDVVASVNDLVTSVMNMQHTLGSLQENQQRSADDLVKIYDRIDRSLGQQVNGMHQLGAGVDLLVADKRSSFFGQIAISKGWLNTEQVNTILEEQIKGSSVFGAP